MAKILAQEVLGITSSSALTGSEIMKRQAEMKLVANDNAENSQEIALLSNGGSQFNTWVDRASTINSGYLREI
ncbi:hypothetical protein N9W34_01455 [Rickettsiales bacterium]|nr:hypothetical protein [Rickettsiales bacterium]